MHIDIQLKSPEERREKPRDESQLGFGRIYSDHMFIMRWTEKEGWHNARICPMEDLHLSAASLVLHYAQAAFEGLKAYYTSSGGVNLFRPQENMKRLNRSASRVTLPQVDEAFLLQAIEQLLTVDKDWIPRSEGASLYIRPTLIAVEPYIGLKSTSEALLFVITSPVGAYYPEGFNPLRIIVNKCYSRACRGGLGEVKAAANYASGLLAEKEAQASGYTQVLWLDAHEKRWVEEVGSMNIFFKLNRKVVTPALNGTILPGITRDSVLKLLKSWNIDCEERPVAIKEVLEAQHAGTLEEVFGSGTAAVISPVGTLHYQNKDYLISEGKSGSLATRLFEELTYIQYGRKSDSFGWVHAVAASNQESAA